MKNIYTIVCCLLILFGAVSCDYLDVVPDERPTEEDAFRDKYAARRYLYSCYSFMPRESQAEQGWLRHGEVLTSTSTPSTDILMGNISAATPGDLRYWSRIYGAFRRVYTFLDNIDGVPRMDEVEKRAYKAEATFLLGYYGFYLMKAYGPFIIPEGEYDYNMSPASYPKRAKFDDCVDWIVGKFDEAMPDLLDKQDVSAYGRATKTIAQSVKSRVLLYAASPLFNGNSKFYAQAPLDPDTNEPLMPQTYDANKWKKALDASEQALAMAKANGFELFYSEPTTDLPYPENTFEYSLRTVYTNIDNNEVIFPDAREQGYYDLQNNCTPRDPDRGSPSWNNFSPSLETVEMFYTENGLPIDEDPEYFSKSEWFDLGEYDGELTANLHLKREPRFYAWISFHNGWYELQRGGQSRIRAKYLKNDTHGVGNRTRNFSKSGYLNKKGVGLDFSTENGFSQYSWPLLRLAELYLNAAEAAVECNELEKGMSYLNEVRKRAGIPTVQESWAGVATIDQNKLRKIVHQERLIELYMEAHRRWDLNRWLEAEAAYNHDPHGLNIYGENEKEFFVSESINMRWGFTSPANYLLPIETGELNKNRHMVQNPGY